MWHFIIGYALGVITVPLVMLIVFLAGINRNGWNQ